jgi:hypothetical protein
MKQEDKIPFLNDLYAKSLHGVHCCIYNYNGTIREEDDIIYYCAAENVVTLNSTSNGECFMYYQVKPYLRLLSSITKKEKEELIDLGLGYIDSGRYEDENGVRIYIGESFQFIPCFELYDWLNSHMFDFRGLIEKGLALEAPKGMYNIK